LHILKLYFDLLIDRDVDKVHDMMDDIAEQQQLAGEISTAIRYINKEIKYLKKSLI
jgi:hypothetical protein